MVDVGELADGDEGGVVHDDADFESGDGFGEGVRQVRIGEIESEATGLNTVARPNVSSHLLEERRAARDQQQVQPPSGKIVGERHAEPLRRAGDHRPAAVALVERQLRRRFALPHDARRPQRR